MEMYAGRDEDGDMRGWVQLKGWIEMETQMGGM